MEKMVKAGLAKQNLAILLMLCVDQLGGIKAL